MQNYEITPATITALTVRELGDAAAARGVSAASLLRESGPQPAPSAP